MAEGCTTAVVSKGLCWKHGGGSICREAGCEKKARYDGLCRNHGGYKVYKQDGYEKQANRKGGMCQACYLLSQS